MALGITYGLGSAILTFYNGVILGAVAMDYVNDGQTEFLLGWLLPHGSIELPSLVIASQAGLLLASAMIGWRQSATFRQRLRRVQRDLLALIVGVGCLLVYAGLVEAFVSQFHEPVLPYPLKIAIGVVNLALLTTYLWRAGTRPESTWPA